MAVRKRQNFELFFRRWSVASPLALPPLIGERAGVRTVVLPKEILFEIDLVPGTWYLGKDLRLENHHTSPAVLNDEADSDRRSRTKRRGSVLRVDCTQWRAQCFRRR